MLIAQIHILTLIFPLMLQSNYLRIIHICGFRISEDPFKCFGDCNVVLPIAGHLVNFSTQIMFSHSNCTY